MSLKKKVLSYNSYMVMVYGVVPVMVWTSADESKPRRAVAMAWLTLALQYLAPLGLVVLTKLPNQTKRKNCSSIADGVGDWGVWAFLVFSPCVKGSPKFGDSKK
jgi:hypothetical protein